MNRLFASTLVVGAAFAAAGSATAGYSITQQAAPAPTYSTVLNFDEPGAPTGFVPSNYWAGLGLASLTDGANPGVPIGNVSGSYPARAGDHQQRLAAVLDGGALLLVERGEGVGGEGAHADGSL